MIIAATLLLLPIYCSASNTYTTDLEQDSSQTWSIADASQTGLDLNSDFCVSWWNKKETTGGLDGIVGRMNGAGTYAYDIWWNTDNYLFIAIDDVGSGAHYWPTGLTGSDTYDDINWHQFVVCHDLSAKDTYLYVDGSYISTTHNDSHPTTIYNSSSPFYIGRSAGTNYYFDGLIDEVKIYDTLLTEEEIAAEYDCAPPENETDLVSRWPFDNDGDDAFGSNDLTNNNSCTFQSGDLPFTDDCAAEEPPATSTSTYTLFSTSTSIAMSSGTSLALIFAFIFFFILILFLWYTLTT